VAVDNFVLCENAGVILQWGYLLGCFAVIGGKVCYNLKLDQLDARHSFETSALIVTYSCLLGKRSLLG
jgi:hypothetical protein